MRHLTYDELAAGLDHVRRSPATTGELRLIVTRPTERERALPTVAVLDVDAGVVGDNWLSRGSRHTSDGAADPDKQVTLMNVRAAELVAARSDRVPLAGDQLYVDLDLSVDNLPSGSLLAIGSAMLKVTASPHLGCQKFVDRFGADAMRFVNSREGRALRLRGLNTRVVVPGEIHVGDSVTKVPADVPPQPEPTVDARSPWLRP